MKLWWYKHVRMGHHMDMFNVDFGVDFQAIALPLLIGWEKWPDGWSFFFRFLVFSGGVEAFKESPPGEDKAEFMAAGSLDEMIARINADNLPDPYAGDFKEIE